MQQDSIGQTPLHSAIANKAPEAVLHKLYENIYLHGTYVTRGHITRYTRYTTFWYYLLVFSTQYL